MNEDRNTVFAFSQSFNGKGFIPHALQPESRPSRFAKTMCDSFSFLMIFVHQIGLTQFIIEQMRRAADDIKAIRRT